MSSAIGLGAASDAGELSDGRVFCGDSGGRCAGTSKALVSSRDEKVIGFLPIQFEETWFDTEPRRRAPSRATDRR